MEGPRHPTRSLVALKVLPADVRRPESRDASCGKPSRPSALNHPNIVTIYEIDSDAGVTSSRWSSSRGETLDELIPPKDCRSERGARLRGPDRRRAGRAHDAGIVHRDLKPVEHHGTDDRRGEGARLRPGEAGRAGRRGPRAR